MFFVKSYIHLDLAHKELKVDIDYLGSMSTFICSISFYIMLNFFTVLYMIVFKNVWDKTSSE